MPHIVIGTAGHIDHGKTALVKALTGMDADRLAEEKRRGITIDIGFAHVEAAPGITLSFVDLPGHERFIKNMLAGVSGIDLVLFVIAADEGIKPQTREHFEICRLLGIERGLIAITKADLVGPDAMALIRNEANALVAGSFLENATVVPVSAKTGSGVEEVRTALLRVAGESRQRAISGYFRMPVDRAFSIKGMGTVATGTVISGAVRRGAEVELYPTGRRLRVRGLQVHGVSVDASVSGQRTALNLPGIEASQIERGMVLAEPGRFRPARQLGCRLELLPGATALKARARVHFHCGAAAIQAEVRRLSPCRIVLREATLILPGDRFVVRGGSPLTTIGGGVVLAIDPPRRQPVLQTVADAIARTGKTESEVRLPLPGIELVEPDFLVDAAWLDLERVRLEQEVAVFHKQNPLRPGVPKESLRFTVLDHLLKTSATLVTEDGLVRHRNHVVTPLQQDPETLERVIWEGGLTVPAIADVLIKVRGGARVLPGLIKEGKLVRVSPEFVYHRDALTEVKKVLLTKKGEVFTVAQFRDWTGITRKHAVPLLEFLDRAGVTRRTGDSRITL